MALKTLNPFWRIAIAGALVAGTLPPLEYHTRIFSTTLGRVCAEIQCVPELGQPPSIYEELLGRTLEGAMTYVSRQAPVRLIPDLNAVSPYLTTSLLQSEEQRYWTNNGYDPLSIAKAGLTTALNKLQGNDQVVGGSGILEQLLKLELDSMDSSRQTRIKRAVGALETFQALSDNLGPDGARDAILLAYLNSEPWGGGTIGISEASDYYFQTTPDKLDLAQSVMLTIALRNPNYYAPKGAINPAYAFIQGEALLNAMQERGILAGNEGQAALKKMQKYYAGLNPVADFTSISGWPK